MITKLYDLTYLGLMGIEGEQATHFLQGQLTCDVNALNDHEAKLGAYCNYQGRIIASFWAYHQHEAYFLLMPKDILTHTLTQLQKYAAFSKVKLTDLSNSLSCYGYQHQPPTTLPAEGLHLALQDKQSRYFFISKAPLHHCAEPGDAYWRLLDIRSRIGMVYANTQEQFIPNYLHYEAMHAIAFDKGCYVGQEIIARLHYRGKAKYHPYHVQLGLHTAPPPGTAIKSLCNKPLGTLIDCQITQEQQCEALLLLPVDQANEGEVMMEEQDAAVKYEVLYP